MKKVSKKTKQRMERLIQSEFNKYVNYWEEEERKEIIELAESYGLKELAERLKKDNSVLIG